ncbi:MAG: serine/threonine-protein kinase, partial [Verrucomicrobiota bacterium]
MNPSDRCPECGGPKDRAVLLGLCPTCLVRWTRSPQLPGDLRDSIWLWDGRPGARIQGYELGEEIGRGGSGIVYRARQVSLDRAVAVKLLIEGPFAHPDQVERFRLEAKAAAALEHPSIVPVHEIGEADGRVFYSMGLIEGPTLEKVLDRFCLPATRQRCPDSGIEAGRMLQTRQREIARFLSEAARAVHHAHQHGVLHRDLKPGNILIAEGDRPMITDFGLVWVAGSQHHSGDSGRIHGTPNYIAPELTRDPGRSSVACDIYALGAIGYELVTGEPPFEAGNPLETLLRIRNGHLTPPSDLETSLDPDLEAILLRCLDASPSRRYTTAGDLADDLDRFARGEVV